MYDYSASTITFIVSRRLTKDELRDLRLGRAMCTIDLFRRDCMYYVHARLANGAYSTGTGLIARLRTPRLELDHSPPRNYIWKASWDLPKKIPPEGTLTSDSIA